MCQGPERSQSGAEGRCGLGAQAHNSHQGPLFPYLFPEVFGPLWAL